MLKIMMVDDEKWVRERFSQRIPWSEAGFTFMGAASGAHEAISMMEREVPHVLLTDITMPNMNGLELAAYVRKRWPRIRIVILTAYGEFEYARQAIEIGVDNYLIKLAQTPEQILDACRKVAEDLEQELDIDHMLEMRLKLEREKVWAQKRQWTDRLIEDVSITSLHGMLGDWLEGVAPAAYLASFTMGWRLTASSGQDEPSEEERIGFQRQVAEVLEADLHAKKRISEGFGIVVLPLHHSQLFVLIGAKHPLPAFQINQFVVDIQESLNAFTSVKSVLHVGDVERLGAKALTAGQLADYMRKGLDGLAGYFYLSEGATSKKPATALRRLGAEQMREWTAAVVKALQRKNAELFRETVAVMITPSDQPIHPGDLLRLTKQMLHPELVKLPDAVVARLREVDQLTTWSAYCAWWSETIDAICEQWNHQAQPPITARKEIQWMCRHIREHYQEDLQLAELAKLVHLHPSYAGQMFKQEIGENFLEYVNRVRMEKASEMLERTTMKIYEVSGAVGISDYRYFCKLFKSHTGFTPTQYKNKLG